jgi:hypothetical protein
MADVARHSIKLVHNNSLPISIPTADGTCTLYRYGAGLGC